MRYISRTVNAIENLIWYSESTINSLSCTSHQIFAYLSSSGCNFTEKTVNFHAFFEWFSVNISTTTWKMLMKLGQKLDKMDAKETQNIKRRKYEPLWSYSGSNWQNMPKIYGWSWHKLNESTKMVQVGQLEQFQQLK